MYDREKLFTAVKVPQQVKEQIDALPWVAPLTGMLCDSEDAVRTYSVTHTARYVASHDQRLVSLVHTYTEHGLHDGRSLAVAREVVVSERVRK